MSNLLSLVPFVFSSEVSKTDEQDDDDEPAAIVVVDFQIALSNGKSLATERASFCEAIDCIRSCKLA